LQAFYLLQSMWVDNMVDKSCASYLYKKRGVYYFSKAAGATPNSTVNININAWCNVRDNNYFIALFK